MPLSSFTGLPAIPDPSEATPGLFDARYSILSQNLDQINSDLSTVVYAHAQTGADAGAQLRAAIDALPTAGGIVDARGLLGSQTISSTLTLDRPVTILLSAATFTTTVHPAIAVGSIADTAVIGAGKGRTFFVAAAATGYVLSLASVTVANGHNYFEGLSIRGNATASGGFGVEGNRQGYVLKDIDILSFTSAGAAALTLFGSNSGLFIDCDFRTSETGVSLRTMATNNCNLHTFIGGQISSNSQAVRAVDGSHQMNRFQGVNIASNTSSPAVYAPRGSNFLFSGNFFEGNASGADTYSVQFGDSAAADNASGNVCSNNYVTETDVAYFVRIVRGVNNVANNNFNGSSGMSALVRTETNASQTLVWGNHNPGGATAHIDDGSGSVDAFGIGFGTDFNKGVDGYVFNDSINVDSASGSTFRSRTSHTPTGTGSGTTGDIVWDNDYIYICKSTDSWSRATLNTF